MIPLMIEDLERTDEDSIYQAGKITQLAFAHIPYCDTLEEAVSEVREALMPYKICLVARDLTGDILGWIGGMPIYPRAWELHPLAVLPAKQRQGIGRKLVLALEERVATVGGLTIMLGADDEFGGTNLFGQELFPDVLDAAQKLENVADHPFAFYQKLGYVVTGLVPDANGYGKPDILMCKRIAQGLSSELMAGQGLG
jgi:aminoglycoside 6'-N-acetyltransferase I